MPVPAGRLERDIMRRRLHSLLPIALLAATCLAAAPADAAAIHPTPSGQRLEELHYRWHLGRFLGRIAGLFLPSHGDGVLTLERDDDTLTTELLITSEESDDGEYWRYGAEIDARSGYAESAWSSYQWRGEERSEREEIAEHGVMDVVSGIWAIRRDPPKVTRKMEIWSEGKIYPVVVIPLDRERIRVGDRRVETRHYSVRGYDAPGGHRWKGTLELWLAQDAAATPVEIHIERSLANLQLRLQSLPD